ncbi:uncharacterized protein LOC143024318 [Oratosquilla oratoria]|uniref:uncharacterized protein LOC143024318 n=1 Tax=Oratosquilla oratoria TaxID=337810 RepID=UPI003F757653
MDADKDWIENLIDTVESRPALYDASLKEYADRHEKTRLWNEVCEVMIPNWADFTTEERTIKCKEVRQRWQNLRTCFKRELNEQKKDKLRHSAKKRRKYIYFNQLLFLLPFLDDKEPTGDFKDLERLGEDCEKFQEENIMDEEEFSTNEGARSNTIRHKKKALYEESLLDILKEKKDEVIDEDRSFLISLVPSFKKLTDNQKFEAKIEFLKVLQRIMSTPCPSLHN